MLMGFILLYFIVWAILSLTIKAVRGFDSQKKEHYNFYDH